MKSIEKYSAGRLGKPKHSLVISSLRKVDRSDLNIKCILTAQGRPDNHMGVWTALVTQMPKWKVPMICMDGGNEEMDFEELKALARERPAIIRKISIDFINEERINGVVAYHINENYPGYLIGVENRYLYDKAAKVASELFNNEEDHSQFLNNLLSIFQKKTHFGDPTKRNLKKLIEERITFLRNLFRMSLQSHAYEYLVENRAEFSSSFFLGALRELDGRSDMMSEDEAFIDELDSRVAQALEFYVFCSLRSKALLENTVDIMDKKEVKSAALFISGWHGYYAAKLAMHYSISFELYYSPWEVGEDFRKESLNSYLNDHKFSWTDVSLTEDNTHQYKHRITGYENPLNEIDQ